jgi:hypothetical protein
MTPGTRQAVPRGAACMALLLALHAGPAQAAIPVGLSEGPRGVGLGLILGEPTGLSAAWRGSGASTYDFAVAWSVPESSIHFHADYLREVFSFQDPASPVVDFPVYLGVGPRLRLGDDFHDGRANILGVRVPVGIGVRGGEVPVEGFLEAVPVLVLLSDVRVTLDAALGVRVFFSRKDPPEPPPVSPPNP